MASYIPASNGITILDWDNDESNEDTHLTVDSSVHGDLVTVALLTSTTYGSSSATVHLTHEDALRFADALIVEAGRVA